MSAEWSAKSEVQRESAERQVQGKCRKASADREPTTHVNTLGGQRPRADLWATASSADLRFCFYVLLCLCVWVYAIVGLWGCEFVGVWISVLWVCVCVFTCLCLFGCWVFLCDHV